jgi:hypothetical protein
VAVAAGVVALAEKGAIGLIAECGGMEAVCRRDLEALAEGGGRGVEIGGLVALGEAENLGRGVAGGCGTFLGAGGEEKDAEEGREQRERAGETKSGARGGGRARGWHGRKRGGGSETLPYFARET